MRKYKSINELIAFFFNSNLKLKIKILIKIIGIRFVIYNFLFIILKPFFKSKISFIKSLLFDLIKYKSDYISTSNKSEKYILFTNDNIISKEVFVSGEFDLIKLKKAKKFLSILNFNVERLYDIGANIGVVCIPSVKQGLIRECHAVEAEVNNYKVLKTNIILNDLENKIFTYNYALSNNDNKFVDMEISPSDSGDNRIINKIAFNIHGEETRKIIKVKTKTIDSLFPNLNKNKDLIWIDTQGYEPFILEGSQNAIKQKVPFVIEFWPYGLKRNNNWDRMITILSKFSSYVDLSLDEMKIEKLDNNGVNKLISGWHSEKKNKHSLFTDLLLLG